MSGGCGCGGNGLTCKANISLLFTMVVATAAIVIMFFAKKVNALEVEYGDSTIVSNTPDHPGLTGETTNSDSEGMGE